MVKRIIASFLLVLVGAISILAQIDYNKQIKNAPAVSQGNMNGVRVVDGLKFAQSAAGINAADADLGSGTVGEIWIPSGSTVTATDAQISLTTNHVLRVMGRLFIDAVNKGPILMGPGVRITCSDNAATVGVIAESPSGSTIPSMIRLTVQDGSQSNNMIDGCDIAANTASVTNGVIDATGMQGISWIRDNWINNFASGWGIFIQDVQSGAVGGTSSIQILNNKIVPQAGSGGCIEILHGATNAALLFNFGILDLNCTSGSSIATAPVRIRNTSAGQNIREVNITNALITNIPGGLPGISLDGVFQANVKHVACYSPGSGAAGCVNMTTNAQNGFITTENIVTFPGSNAFPVVDATLQGSLPATQGLGYYNNAANSFAGTVTTGNFNNIRIVDGIRFAQSAAGINAADADLGAATGEIWITANAVTATDAQITISGGHTLRIFSQLQIDASAKGPILLKAAAKVSCNTTGPDTNNGSIINTGAGAAASMIRLFTQDGSQNNNAIEGCNIIHNGGNITNGIIDASGMSGRGWIRDNKIQSFNSGLGIFIQDIQSGALIGANNLQIMNNQITATGTGACIQITHSATNAETIGNIDILDTNCTAGASSGTSIVLQNNDTSASHLHSIVISNMNINGTPAAQTSLAIVGVQQLSARNVTCASGTTCVNIFNSANNMLQTFDNILTYSGNTALNDALNGVGLATSVLHYSYPNNLNSYDYLNAVSYLRLNGLAPASCSSTGTGTGATCGFGTNSFNNGGVIGVTAGTTAATSGTITLNFNVTQTNFGSTFANCVATLDNGTGTWNARATLIGQTSSTTQFVWNWDNNAVALTNGSSYDVNYWCNAK